MSFWDDLEKETQAERTKSKENLNSRIAEARAEQERAERRLSMEVQVTKCYLVQVLDKDGNELACEYAFTDTKKEAEAVGERLKDEFLEKE